VERVDDGVALSKALRRPDVRAGMFGRMMWANDVGEPMERREPSGGAGGELALTVGENVLTVGENALTVGKNVLTVGKNALTGRAHALTGGTRAPMS
jgi:hypothetical protein